MTTPQWAPAEVLQLDPNSSSFTCIGYAPSKGRRCRNPIAYDNRQESTMILHKMSRLDPQSRRVDNKLEELASRLLCRRWHQGQAADMKRQWRRDIEIYEAAEAARRQERMVDLMERLLTTARVRVERSIIVHAPPAPVHSTRARTRPTSRRADRTVSSVAQLRIEGSFSATMTMATREEPRGSEIEELDEEESGQETDPDSDSSSQQEAPSQRTNHRRNNSSRTSSANERTTYIPHSSLRRQIMSTREEVTVTDEGESEGESEEPLPESPTQDHAQQEPLHAHGPRAIEGDCSICCEEFSSGDDTVWCRAQCMQNFHADCIRSWHHFLVADGRVKKCPYW